MLRFLGGRQGLAGRGSADGRPPPRGAALAARSGFRDAPHPGPGLASHRRTSHRAAALLSVAGAALLAAHGHAMGDPPLGAGPAPTVGRKSSVYVQACASCHGIDGRGIDRSEMRGDVTTPDFTDCAFTSREQLSDWMGVVHNGGPSRGFDRMMPAFGEALAEEEMLEALLYVRTFCRNDGWPQGDLNLPRGLHVEKAFPENEVLLVAERSTEGRVEYAGKLFLEKRVGPRSQIEAIVPFGARSRDKAAEGKGGWIGALGDVAVGAKHVVLDSPATGTIASLGAEAILPTGSERDGFGEGTLIFEPFLAMGQRIPKVGFLQLHSGAELPYREWTAKKKLFGRLAVGRSLSLSRFGRTVTPMFELLASGEPGGPGIDWDGVPEVQIALSRRKHVRANVGLRCPLNDASARTTSVVAYLLWDWFDGGIDEGF